MNWIKTMKMGFLLALIVSLPGILSAQTKFGHVNIDQLRTAMPEFVAANKKLDTLAQQLNNQMIELGEEYKKKITEYQSGKFSSDAMRDLKGAEIQQLEERIMAFKESANQDLQKQTEQLMIPINKKIKDAIKAVATEGGYTYIFDSGSDALLFAADADDVMPMVKKKLGIK